MASMRNWLHDEDTNKAGRVVVAHCKAGKGRSGTAVCGYLISEEGWEREDALARFTARRMRPGFGSGISIPSQLRWVGYVDRWTQTGKRYIERQIEVLELHVWGLRDGVKVSIQGYVDEGRTIKTFHVFDRNERFIIDGSASSGGPCADTVGVNRNSNDVMNISGSSHQCGHTPEHPRSLTDPNQLSSQLQSKTSTTPPDASERGGKAVIFRSVDRVVLPTSDICIDFERRNRATYGWAMVTAVAHVWFNAYFEGLTSPTDPQSSPNGVFEIEWDAMDGIKGSSRKGTRALDRLAVVWRALDKDEDMEPKLVKEPAVGEEVPQTRPADWKKQDESTGDDGRDLGMRAEPTLDKVDGVGSSTS
jgi:protein-tyrosine phosphatase